MSDRIPLSYEYKHLCPNFLFKDFRPGRESTRRTGPAKFLKFQGSHNQIMNCILNVHITQGYHLYNIIDLAVSQSLCPKPKKPDSYPCPCLAAQARNGLLPPSVCNCLMTLEMPLQWPINISSSQQAPEKKKCSSTKPM